LSGFPTIWAQNIKDVTLHHAGPPVAAIPKIAEQATKDLGFTISMQATESMDLLNRFLAQSNAIDVGDVSIVFLKYLVGRNVLQAIPVSKFKDWDKVIPLFGKGVYPNGSEASTQGVAPYTVLFATGADGQKFAAAPTEWLTGIPTITNADTLGVRPDLVGRPIDSWADLISPEFKGKAALQDQPTVGVIDVAMALEARGDIKYGNKGNMTKAEIEKTIDTMIAIKKSGHFRSFWSSFDQSVNLMASGEVVIQSMWSPAVTAVKARGIPIVYQPLREGLPRLGLYLGADAAFERPQARLLLRIHELVHFRLPGRLHRPAGLLLLDPGQCQKIPDRGGVGLLVRRQAGCDRHHRSLWQTDGKSRRRP
jgi:putative spermidine/putrescine transport system substrate-binding protein